MHVIVVGAGLAGLSVAWYLRDGGAKVTILERNTGPGLEASFANGALLHPSMVEPWNSPGVMRLLLQNIGRADSPMLIRARVLPSLLGWGVRFIRASRADRFLVSTRNNLTLARYSIELMGSCGSRLVSSTVRTLADLCRFSATKRWRGIRSHGCHSSWTSDSNIGR